MIHFVGAGPGDPELITAKGVRLLQHADAVIYDRLVNPLLLFHCKEDCLFIYVGKTPDQPSINQAEINAKLIETAGSHESVVRLKGGDPAIFGRLTEELEACQEAGIRFEIIPGITAASGTASYSGISLTQRGVATAVTFTTGRLIANEKNTFQQLLNGQTVCLYMGVEALDRFVAAALAQGLKADTPMLITQWGTYGRQSKTQGTLADIRQKISAAKIENPAMIILGEVVHAGERFDWFSDLPQKGASKLYVSSRKPDLDALLEETQKGADVWWVQVGESRDRRFDQVNSHYLAEQHFETIIFDDATAKKIYEAEMGKTPWEH
ncbi:uroporphyrinogen-III C-methyltransferase [Trichococcus ilyis]|uniref:uroporphyrinogen-III C-methyltransferase n=1 Tax=Trichococcus ilyis TaxID=640938 RepID=A0A143Y5G2_9LACT|nr:uroporphyrinogen-III C-methyltransferase [Trichococcus ilyis]CZQ80323.1 tetrapyrrole methylase [Trichococcus ilyis]SEI56573.1 uroporphyrin-III C-methyltransferase [Trichococcus ilyis]